MKKNKTVAYMMAAMLLVGGTFAGTKALFTDYVKASNDLVITMGEVDLDIDENDGWKIFNSNGEVKETKKGKEFTHLKTGDILVKQINIKNTGDLQTKLSITKEGEINNLPSGITFTDETLKALNGKILKPKDEVKAELMLTVKGNGNDLHNDRTGSLNMDEEVKVDFSKIKYNVEARQLESEELQ